MLTEKEVLAEISRSRNLHGPLTKDLSRAALILARETLEAIQEAHDAERLPRLSSQRSTQLSMLRAELVQVVAVSAQWVANIDEQQERENHEYEKAHLDHPGRTVGERGQGHGGGGAV